MARQNLIVTQIVEVRNTIANEHRFSESEKASLFKNLKSLDSLASGHGDVVIVQPAILNIAIQQKCSELSTLLLHNTNISVSNIDAIVLGGNALHRACGFGLDNIVGLLLSKNFTLLARDSKSLSALHRAAARGYDSIVKMLLNAGSPSFVNERDRDSPAHFCARNNRLSTLKILVEKDNSFLTCIGEDGCTLLHRAVEYRNLDIIAYLLEQNIDLEATNKFGATALWYATEAESVDVLDMLIKAGANVNHLLNNEALLHLAVHKDNHVLIEKLISNGASLDILDRWGRAPLSIAVCNKNIAAFNTLVKSSANINILDNKGRSLLYCVDGKSSESFHMLSLIIESGIDKKFKYGYPEELAFSILTTFGYQPKLFGIGETYNLDNELHVDFSSVFADIIKYFTDKIFFQGKGKSRL